MRPEIHIFSGLGSSIFPRLSYGTRTLLALTDKLPVHAQHHVWDEHKAVSRGILDRWKRTKEPFPVALIGHSNGVIATNSIALELGAAGYPVDYLAAIDPTAAEFPPIHSNVRETSEFWASSGWPAMKRRFTGNRRAALHYFDQWPGIKRLYHIPGWHIACAENPRVHQVILDDLKRVLG